MTVRFKAGLGTDVGPFLMTFVTVRDEFENKTGMPFFFFFFFLKTSVSQMSVLPFWFALKKRVFWWVVGWWCYIICLCIFYRFEIGLVD